MWLVFSIQHEMYSLYSNYVTIACKIWSAWFFYKKGSIKSYSKDMFLCYKRLSLCESILKQNFHKNIKLHWLTLMMVLNISSEPNPLIWMIFEESWVWRLVEWLLKLEFCHYRNKVHLKVYSNGKAILSCNKIYLLLENVQITFTML